MLIYSRMQFLYGNKYLREFQNRKTDSIKTVSLLHAVNVDDVAKWHNKLFWAVTYKQRIEYVLRVCDHFINVTCGKKLTKIQRDYYIKL